ncbi:MAG: fumarylacetoacetate hydrolase family protein [Betaproteobacteria bacterium]|nr:fumarylacetoacetate hydrolase family protein [Betaproteobacteria bacterium]
MKIARFWTSRGPRYGIVRHDEVIELRASPFVNRDLDPWGPRYRLGELRLLAPTEPSKIILGSRNYRTMLKNRGWAEPGEVMFGLKPLGALAGPDEPILLPPGGGSYTFECELAVVIGRTCAEVSEADVDKYVLGYTCFNDSQVFDIYDKTTLTYHSKGYDSFAPVGPVIQTEMDPNDVRIKAYVNGRLSADTHTSDMIFNPAKLVSTVSHMMTLFPGDIIATGNSGGKLPIKPGDHIDIEIDHIGTLSNPVAARIYPKNAPHEGTAISTI